MEERFIIRGSGGKRTLSGKVFVRGAKNAALKALAAAFLFKDEMTMVNVPDIGDVAQMISIMKELGVEIKKKGSSYFLYTPERSDCHLSRERAKRLRASIVLTGPLLARFGKVSFPHPGGCLIGARPVDLFLGGFEKMGARISRKGEYFTIKAPNGGLRGAEIFFKNQSVTGTETLMMAGVGAQGKTVLKNSALEPEIKALADYLNACGARIEGAGTPTIIISGTPPLRARGKKFHTPPDRIEAGSFLILGALMARDLTILRCAPSHLEALIDFLKRTGARVDVEKSSLRVRGSTAKLHSTDLKTHEYPGFPTDLQALATVYLTQTYGKATVFDTIFDGRFGYIDEIEHMGADIDICDPHRVIIRGPTPLCGKELQSPDLRAGLAYIIAAAIAKGESVIHNVYNIDRGYEKIEERLRNIGVDIRRIKNNE